MMIHLADNTASTNPLLPSWPEFIIGTILFVLVFGFLARLALPRIQQILTERTEQIEGGLARSEEVQAEAQQLLEQYRQQLAEARHTPPGCARRPVSRARRSSPRCASR